MNSERFVLSIQKPWISCYTTYSHLLSILQCDERTHEWIYSNFIQMYMNKDLNENWWGEFYKPMPYELSFFEICKWIEFQKIRRNNVTTNKKNILDFVISELRQGYYLHLQIEHKYIKSFENNKHFHDALIYGIDLNKEIVYAQDVFFKGIYEIKVLTIDEFLDSVYYCKIPEEHDYTKDSIYSYKIKRNCDYEFDEKNIWNQMKDYYNSKIPEYWRLYNSANRKNMCFGIEIYDALINYMKTVEFAKINIRPFYVLKDHFIILKKTVEYLKQSYFRINFKYDNLIDIYDELLALADILNMLLLISREFPEREKKHKIISLIDEMRLKEAKIIDLI